MKTMTFKATLLSLCLLSSALTASTWKNPKTGTEFAIGDRSLDWDKAQKFCEEKGMVIYDERYVSPGDQGVMKDSSLLRLLPWKPLKRHQNAETVTLWEGTGVVDYRPGGFRRGAIARTLVRSKPGHDLHESRQWRNLASGGHALCVDVGYFWFQCSIDMTCLGANRSTNGFPRWTFTDGGPSKDEAIGRIVKLASRPEYSVQEKTCALRTDNVYCKQVHPY